MADDWYDLPEPKDDWYDLPEPKQQQPADKLAGMLDAVKPFGVPEAQKITIADPDLGDRQVNIHPQQAFNAGFEQRTQKGESPAQYFGERLPWLRHAVTAEKFGALKGAADRAATGQATDEDFKLLGDYKAEQEIQSQKGDLRKVFVDPAVSLPAEILEWVTAGKAAAPVSAFARKSATAAVEKVLPGLLENRFATFAGRAAAEGAARTAINAPAAFAGTLQGLQQGQDPVTAFTQDAARRMIGNTVFSGLGAYEHGLAGNRFQSAARGVGASQAIQEAEYQAGLSPQSSAVHRVIGGDLEALKELGGQAAIFGGLGLAAKPFQKKNPFVPEPESMPAEAKFPPPEPPPKPFDVEPPIVEKPAEGSIDIPANGVMPSAEQRTSDVPQIDFKPPSNTVMDGLRKVLAPASRGPEAGQAAGIIRENLAERERKTAIAQNALAQGKAILDKQVVDAPDPQTRTAKFTQFTDAIEHGRIDSLPEDIKPIAQTIREQTDQRTQAIKDRGMLKTFIEDYMGHIWNRGGTSKEDIGKILAGRKPLAGSEAFKKERSIPTFSEGIEMGLEPASWNPVELSLLKLREMDKAIAAHDISTELKDQGLMKFIGLGGEVPEGWKTFNDKMSRVFYRPEEGPGPVLAGNWYVPETVGKLIDNHLSPGMADYAGKAFDVYRETGNTMNQLQLGFSAFHLGFVGMDTQTSAAALAFQKASSGNLLGAIKELPSAAIPLVGPMRTFLKGSKVLSEYYKPGSQGAATAEIVDQLMKAGGRAKMDSFYGGTQVEAFRKAIKDVGRGELGQAPAALRHAIPAIAEAVSKPVMEYLVPRMKLGVFADLAQSELQRTGATSLTEQRAVLGKAWDSVENRLGQMTYDNIFWHRTLKDGLMASVRSVGWNLGTMREIGGGIKDIPQSIIGTAKGEGISPRTAYLIALPAVTAIYGAMYQYLATGQGPDELKDYFFPKTGRTRKDGTPDRVSLPSYMRDIAAATNRATDGPFRVIQNLGSMAKHKLHPLIGTVAEMISNEDYYGKAVIDPMDKAVGQSLDMAKQAVKGFEPFVLRSYNQQKESGADTSQAVQGFFGITPAPAYVARTDQEQVARESKMGSFQTPLEKLRRERYGKFTPLMDKLGAMPDATDAFAAVGKTARGESPIPRDLDFEKQQAVNDFLGQQSQHAMSHRPTRTLGETPTHYQERIAKWQSTVEDARKILDDAGVSPGEQRRLINQLNRNRALKATGR
jgi:hypothetical protein